MLEVIGAGTGSSNNTVDFATFYKDSELNVSNTIHINELCTPTDETITALAKNHSVKVKVEYNSTYLMQFIWLYKKVSIIIREVNVKMTKKEKRNR